MNKKNYELLNNTETVRKKIFILKGFAKIQKIIKFQEKAKIFQNIFRSFANNPKQ